MDIIRRKRNRVRERGRGEEERNEENRLRGAKV